MTAARVGLVATSLAAAALALPWNASSGLLAGSHDSACQGALLAELGSVAATVGAAVALAALVAGIRRAVGLGWRLLGAYALLLAFSATVFVTCG